MEWLQIKDRDFSYSRPNTICSFLREKEDSEESAQAQDKLTEESEGEVSGGGNSDMNCDLEKQHSLEIDASIPLPDSPASGAEDSPSGSVALDDAPPWCQLWSFQNFSMELTGQLLNANFYRPWHDFQFIWAINSGKMDIVFFCIAFMFGL